MLLLRLTFRTSFETCFELIHFNGYPTALNIFSNGSRTISEGSPFYHHNTSRLIFGPPTVATVSKEELMTPVTPSSVQDESRSITIVHLHYHHPPAHPRPNSNAGNSADYSCTGAIVLFDPHGSSTEAHVFLEMLKFNSRTAIEECRKINRFLTKVIVEIHHNHIRL